MTPHRRLTWRATSIFVAAFALASGGCAVATTNTGPTSRTTTASTFVTTFDPRAMAAAISGVTSAAVCTAPPSLGRTENHGPGTADRTVLRGGATFSCTFNGTDRELVALWSTQVADRIEKSDVTVHGKGVGDGVTDEWIYTKGSLDGVIQLVALANGTGTFWLIIEVVEVF